MYSTNRFRVRQRFKFRFWQWEYRYVQFSEFEQRRKCGLWVQIFRCSILSRTPLNSQNEGTSKGTKNRRGYKKRGESENVVTLIKLKINLEELRTLDNCTGTFSVWFCCIVGIYERHHMFKTFTNGTVNVFSLFYGLICKLLITDGKNYSVKNQSDPFRLLTKWWSLRLMKGCRLVT